MDFHEIWHWEVLLKFVSTFQFWSKLDNNNGLFMWKPTGVSVLWTDCEPGHSLVIHKDQTLEKVLCIHFLTCQIGIHTEVSLWRNVIMEPLKTHHTFLQFHGKLLRNLCNISTQVTASAERSPTISPLNFVVRFYCILILKYNSKKCNSTFTCLIQTYHICACISHIFLTRIYPPKLGCGLHMEYYVLLTTEPATTVLYVVKLPVETASVWDLSCKLLHTRKCANVLPVYRHILITWE
jgi:hypothetical protein